MIQVPGESSFLEIKKQMKTDTPSRSSSEVPGKGDAGGKAKEAGISSLSEQLTDPGAAPGASPEEAGGGFGTNVKRGTIYSKFSEFVESDGSGLINFQSMKNSLRTATQFATTSIWSLLRKTLDEDEQEDEEALVLLLAAMMKVESNFTYEHSQRVMEWSASLAQELGLDPGEVAEIKRGAFFRDIGKTGVFFAEVGDEEKDSITEFLGAQKHALKECGELHDIGKLQIPKEIVHKTSRLTDEEYEIMKQHPVIGEAILKPIKSLQHILPAVRHHHEKWDGTGYPDSLKGESIPISARIVSLVDSFDAMIEDRPYRKAMPIDQAVNELRKNAGIQFDPLIVRKFLSILESEGIAASAEASKESKKNAAPFQWIAGNAPPFSWKKKK